MHGGGPFRREHVHLGAGEVRQPAGVVDVEMGDRDVADVAGVEAEAADLLQRRLAELALAVGTPTVNGTPSRRCGWATSSAPKPVSTSTSASPVSISRQ